jgi:hypothetical protein
LDEALAHLLWLRLEEALIHLLLLRWEELLLLLLHDDGLHHAMYSRIPELLGNLRQLLATLFLHRVAVPLLKDPRPKDRDNCQWFALLHEELSALVQLLL